LLTYFHLGSKFYVSFGGLRMVKIDKKKRGKKRKGKKVEEKRKKKK